MMPNNRFQPTYPPSAGTRLNPGVGRTRSALRLKGGEAEACWRCAHAGVGFLRIRCNAGHEGEFLRAAGAVPHRSTVKLGGRPHPR